MYLVEDIIEVMDEYAPCSLAEDFDTVGLQVGNRKSGVTGILVTLDVRDETIEEAIDKKCNLIVSHHPLFLGGIKQIDYSTPIGHRISKLILNGISLFVSHTNFDICDVGTNDALFEKLHLKNKEYLNDDNNLGRVGTLKNETTLKNYVQLVKERLNLSHVRVVGLEDTIIKKVSICTGSGGYYNLMDLSKKKGADLYITGDLTYHKMQYAEDIGLSIIDGTHYYTEILGIENFRDILNNKFEKLDVFTSYSGGNIFNIY